MATAKWRILDKGEIIEAGDEADLCRDPWHDEPKWRPVSTQMIGQPASDPRFIAHVRYRRRVK